MVGASEREAAVSWMRAKQRREMPIAPLGTVNDSRSNVDTCNRLLPWRPELGCRERTRVRAGRRGREPRAAANGRGSEPGGWGGGAAYAREEAGPERRQLPVGAELRAERRQGALLQHGA